MIKKISKPLVILSVGLLLLAISAVGSTRAALNARSEKYIMQANTPKLHVDLLEEQNGSFVSVEGEDTLKFTSIDRNNFHIGQTYPEKVKVVNNDGCKEFVRVTVKKSWANPDKTKDTTLDPRLIELGVNTADWYENPSESTAEESVYYLLPVFNPGEEKILLNSVKINGQVLEKVTVEDYFENGTKVEGTVVNKYEYNGKSFYVEVKVDAVQNHSPISAIKNAWGIDVDADENMIHKIK
ncbi:MAG: hypothetical protein K5769_03440 [Pseudobutyrivibrio sp.]|nr:hypothetical protein [Pseudobutyrivibrio sp.]